MLLVVALSLCFASTIGIERLPIIATLIEPRNAVTIAAVLLGALGSLAAVLLRSVRRVLLPLALAVLLAGAVSALVAFHRGFADPRPAAVAVSQLRVLSWNTNGELVGPGTVARVAETEHANVIVLPEVASRTGGRAYVAALQHDGLVMRAYSPRGAGVVETLVLVSTALGEYRDDVRHGPDASRSAELIPLTPGLPTIVALHAAQPSFGDVDRWKKDLEWVTAQCRRGSVVAAGDFNATVDGVGSAQLARCRDAASERAGASVGSWPTALPTWVAMPIDHVLASPDWHIDSFTVITTEDHSGARHRPVLAVVTRNAAPAQR